MVGVDGLIEYSSSVEAESICSLSENPVARVQTKGECQIGHKRQQVLRQVSACLFFDIA